VSRETVSTGQTLPGADDRTGTDAMTLW
jgi:hypothetical protein